MRNAPFEHVSLSSSIPGQRAMIAEEAHTAKAASKVKFYSDDDYDQEGDESHSDR